MNDMPDILQIVEILRGDLSNVEDEVAYLNAQLADALRRRNALDEAVAALHRAFNA